MELSGKQKRISAVGNLAKTAMVKTAGPFTRIGKSPDEAYGDLFKAVQSGRIYGDGKIFVDLVPKKRAAELQKAYQKAHEKPGFELRTFVAQNFFEFAPHKERPLYVPAPGISPREHVTHLWGELERRNRVNRGSLIALPHPYIVPGGRFSEQFYWDTYFIMLGLAADSRWDMIEGMMKNYAYMFRKFGMIPTANRTYFLSRSQPPFFVHMVKLLATYRGRKHVYPEYLPYLIAEYRFWMKGKKLLNDKADNRAYLRVLKMPDGVVLNRYFDNKSTPRPESASEDEMVAKIATNDYKDKLFVDLRAGAESGWDFSSRWFGNGATIDSIVTTDMAAVDLNSLLYTLEKTIAEVYVQLLQPTLARRFMLAAEKRAQAVRDYCWNADEQFFCDYNFREGKVANAVSLAGVFPLYAKIATPEQAAHVAERLRRDFLKPGGLLTTLSTTGQQWDSPNGWAPLQWVAVQALREYGYFELANKIRDNWLHANELVFKNERKMTEKYDVLVPGNLGGGGEYALQDGFGWTNGVYAALKDEQLRGGETHER